MKNLYLLLAILGTVVPYVFFIEFIGQSGVMGFIPAWFANGAVSGLSADLLISSAVFWLVLWQQNAKHGWVFVLLNLSIGLSCALPLYCYFRARSESMPLQMSSI